MTVPLGETSYDVHGPFRPSLDCRSAVSFGPKMPTIGKAVFQERPSPHAGWGAARY